MTTGSEKILVVGPSWVGDMVMSQSLYIHLENTRPGAVIDVLAPAWSEPILARMPQVSRAIKLPTDHGELALGRRRQLGRQLRAEAYSQAILLPNSFKSALVPWFAGVGRRTGWRGEWRYGLLNDLRRLDAEALPLMVQRFVALGMEPGAEPPRNCPVPRLVVDREQALAHRTSFGLQPDRPILALCPGAEFGGAKRWPAEYYAALATEYLDLGWQVVLYGSANDQPVTSEIHQRCGAHQYCTDLAGRTSLAEAVDLLSLSGAVVSNDSGLMHIAAALRCPVLVVYGATSPVFPPPLSRTSQVLVSDIVCSPCFQRECPLQHHRCMREMLPAQVSAELAALLQRSGGGA